MYINWLSCYVAMANKDINSLTVSLLHTSRDMYMAHAAQGL